MQTQPINLDWLRIEVGLTKLTISRRESPRSWNVLVWYTHVWPDGKMSPQHFGYEVTELEFDVSLEMKRREIRTRLRMARLKMLQEVEEAIRSRRLGGKPFRDLCPLGVGLQKIKEREKDAKETFAKQIRVHRPEAGDADQRWALHHKPTDIVIYFEPDEVSEEGIRRAAREAIPRLNQALQEHLKRAANNA